MVELWNVVRALVRGVDWELTAIWIAFGLVLSAGLADLFL